MSSEGLHNLWRHRQSKYFAGKKAEGKRERKKHEKHSTSCWHTYHALNRHLRVCYSCWQMSLHTHTHTHTHRNLLNPKSTSSSSSTARWPIKVARHLSSSVIFFGFFLVLLQPSIKKKKNINQNCRPASPKVCFFPVFSFFLSFTIRNVVHGFVFRLEPICFSLSWSDKCNFRQSLLPCD